MDPTEVAKRDVPAWRDTMRPVRFYLFDARLLLAVPWLFLPTWWTTAAVLAAALACRAAEARGYYRVRAAMRALRSLSAGRRRALHAGRERRFTDFGWRSKT